MGKSFKQSLIEKIKEFQKNAVVLLNCSEILPSVNTPDSDFVIIGPSHPWGKLPQSIMHNQTDVFNEYNHLVEIGLSLLSNALPEANKQFQDQSKPILEFIEQTTYTWCESIPKATSALKDYINKQIEAINSIHGKIGTGKILIPDTNVFISNPKLHEYKMNYNSNILILPTILSELDELKILHGNENVRNKAETAVRNIKEYRRRGRLLDGVKITNKIFLYSIATEPKFDNMPTWLDPNNKDDRFLALCIEAASKFPDSELAILTLDVSLQNKADYALFPYQDPLVEKIL